MFGRKNNKQNNNNKSDKVNWLKLYQDKKHKLEDDINYHIDLRHKSILYVITENLQKFQYNVGESRIELITDNYDIYIYHNRDIGLKIHYKDINKINEYLSYKYDDDEIQDISKIYFQKEYENQERELLDRLKREKEKYENIKDLHLLTFRKNKIKSIRNENK